MPDESVNIGGFLIRLVVDEEFDRALERKGHSPLIANTI